MVYLRQVCKTLLFTPIPASTLGLFRFFLGLSLLYEALRLLQHYQDFFARPPFLFKYIGFSWVNVLPETILFLLLILLLVSALGILLGLFFRLSCWTYILIYLYFFLLDCSHYNNHYYLILLITAIISFTDAHYWGSWHHQKLHTKPILSWQVNLLKIQLLIVYFYGGLAKLNTDWLQMNVMRAGFADNPQIIPAFLPFSTNSLSFFYTYGGLLFDLWIGGLLWYKPTRLLAIFLVFFFHLTNAFTLDIGVFPYFMIGASVLFLETHTPQKWLNFWKKKETRTVNNTNILTIHTNHKKAICIFASMYLIVQLFLPIRHHLIKGNVDWTGEGQFFAWRMKMPHKKLHAFEVNVTHLQTQENYPINVSITDKQLNALIYYPYLMAQFKEHILQKLPKGVNTDEVKVTANVQVSMNGHEAQDVYNTKLNLVSISDELYKASNYICPFRASR